MRVSFFGAAKGVTGSCFLLEASGKRILIDCGMFQGLEEEKNYQPLPFDPRTIDYLILTHAHIDHCGRLPLLVKEGFKGTLLCTEPTYKIARFMLLDAAKVMYENYKTSLKKYARIGKEPREPLYDEHDVLDVFELPKKFLKYGEKFSISSHLKVTFKDAGHILGSSFVEFEVYEDGRIKRVVFSGDLGNKNKPIVNDPSYPEKADYVIMESTYGDRLHKSFEDSKMELLDAINYAFSRDGNVIIPSYALERAQEILYVLREFHEKNLLPRCQIFLDSPLAINLLKVFLSSVEFYDEETKKVFLEKNPFMLPNLYFTSSVEESKAINSVRSNAIIIAGSGMLTGGRILHHLKYNLWREECALVFVGYQPKGTLGRKIVDGQETVNIFGEEIRVAAKVYTINGFSSHADQEELLEWLSYTQNPSMVYLIHGEEEKMEILKQKIKERLGFNVYIPNFMESVEL
ncbi:MBL fold metallo-hydrolase RNA specificity domain-containing protein [Thermocrinis minervae]|uniref:Metallo-beta-lactamase family protein n=1 Tax=Thermocrinis minervae TaxID=381751 RepID=A0A1M6R9T8_9AQUI|nr:MBL fold metallo-hydrolase [Thermocrinis minervae]SHK29235.1 metallo-beta-lactamase family protein [Thermocrinis minervae]